MLSWFAITVESIYTLSVFIDTFVLEDEVTAEALDFDDSVLSSSGGYVLTPFEVHPPTKQFLATYEPTPLVWR
jgi:hypothetical protein